MDPRENPPDKREAPEGDLPEVEKSFDFPPPERIVPEEAPGIDDPENEQLDLDLEVDFDQDTSDNLSDLDEENQYGNL